MSCAACPLKLSYDYDKGGSRSAHVYMCGLPESRPLADEIEREGHTL